MNVNHTSTTIDLELPIRVRHHCDHDHGRTGYAIEPAEGFEPNSFYLHGTVDEMLAFADKIIGAVAARTNERLDEAAELAGRIAPATISDTDLQRLVSVAEAAAKADGDVEGAIREELTTIRTPMPPVCVGQAPAAAR